LALSPVKISKIPILASHQVDGVHKPVEDTYFMDCPFVGEVVETFSRKARDSRSLMYSSQDGVIRPSESTIGASRSGTGLLMRL